MKKHPFLLRFGARVSGCFWPLILVPLFLSCDTSTEVEYSFWEGTLVPLGTNFETGNAAAVTQFGRTEVSVEIRQGTAETTYGWYLQTAACQADGLVAGGVASYPPLATDESGVATASAVISTLLRSGRSYAVRLYRPLEDQGEELVACADLQETEG
jgi:hypothetical protein